MKDVGSGCGAARIAALLIVASLPLLSSCHATLPAYTVPPPEQEEHVEVLLARKVEAVTVPWGGGAPALAYNAALQAAVGLGFEPTFGSADAGVLKVERVAIDEAATEYGEQRRLEIWEGMSHAEREATPPDSKLRQRIAYWRRLRISALFSQSHVLITPMVLVCLERGRDLSCSQGAYLSADEEQLLSKLVNVIEVAGPKQRAGEAEERRAPNSQTAADI